jgi:hypothetical protein
MPFAGMTVRLPLLSAALFLAALGCAQAAESVPADVTRYIDRRAACNYWPFEKAGKDKVRKGEVERHVRNLNCDTLVREEAILKARYRDGPAILQAIADAHDAVPD